MYNTGEDISLKKFSFFTHIINKFVKEEEKKKKTTDWPTVIWEIFKVKNFSWVPLPHEN